MHLQDSPTAAMALHSAIDCNPVTIAPTTPLVEAIALMSLEKRPCSFRQDRSLPTESMIPKPSASCVLVLDQGRLVGLVTQRDCVKFVTQGLNFTEVTVEDVMTRPLITLKQSEFDDILSILNLLDQHHIHHLPIVNDWGELVGLITADRLMQLWQQDIYQQRGTNEELELRVQQRTAELGKVNAQLRQQIQEQERIETALQQEFDLLARIMETSPVGIMMVNPEGKIILASDQAEKLLGLTKVQIRQRAYNIAHLQLTDYQGNSLLADEFPFQQVMTTGQAVYDMRHAVNLPDRGRVLLSINGAPLFEDQQQLKGVVLAIEDVTNRVQAEEALRQSEERFRMVADFTYDWEYWLSPEGNFIYVSPSCQRTTGYSADEFLQDSSLLSAIIHPHDRGILTQHHCEDAVEPKQPVTDFRIITKSGEIRWIAHICQPVYSAEGRCLGVRASNRDITDRKFAEDALRESESTLRSFYNSAAMMMGIVEVLDDDIRHISDNLTASKFFGQSPEAMRYQLASHLNIPQPILRKWMDHYRESQQTGQPVRFEYLHPTSTDIRWLSATVCPIAGEMADSSPKESPGMSLLSCQSQPTLTVPKLSVTLPKFSRFCYVIEDITERKQAEEALQQLNEQLTGWVSELRTRNREMVLLSQMSDFLQACQTVDEAYHAIATLIEPLFPGISGGVFILDASNHWVDGVATWGTPNLASQLLFTPSQCWALRRGRLHWVNQHQSGLLCSHIHPHTSPPESLCVPLIAQGNALGILYLNSSAVGQLTESKRQLAVTVAEHLALALANLQLHETLAQQSIRDPLTGLFNRRYMEESLDREIHLAQRKQRPMSIMMLDIDHFKRFNDTFGHEAGDAILQELGTFLQRNIRGSDIACRYGGEEIILILPEASLEDTWQRAEQIRQGVKHLTVNHRGHLLGAIAISLGVSTFPDHGITAQSLIEAADRALYRAKAEGRDRVVCAPICR